MNAPLDKRLKQKEAELRLKLASLPEELKEWRARATEANSLRKNSSQIRRLSLHIAALQASISSEFCQAVERDELWREAGRLENKALIVHAVWDQFRSRLSLRLISPFDTYLALADAYARECYVPTYRILLGIPSDQLCPAPLITFGEQASPWVKPESDGAEGDAEPTALLTSQQFQDALDQLPLTLVGVPWSYLTYLPHMALLAHEIGHAIERSSGLTVRLDQAIDGAELCDATRRVAWKAWRREVFADWYGCAMGGPAFVLSLADHLADEQRKILQQTRPQLNGDWTSYPTATVRILFCCESLRAMGFGTEAAGIAVDWRQAYPENRLESFGVDFTAVLHAFSQVLDLTRQEYDGFRRPMFDTATKIANLCRQGGALGSTPRPARAHVAAARLLVQVPPANGQAQDLWQKLRQHHLNTKSGAVAGARAGPSPAEAAAPEAAAVDRLRATLFANV